VFLNQDEEHVRSMGSIEFVKILRGRDPKSKQHAFKGKDEKKGAKKKWLEKRAKSPGIKGEKSKGNGGKANFRFEADKTKAKPFGWKGWVWCAPPQTVGVLWGPWPGERWVQPDMCGRDVSGCGGRKM